MGISEKLNIKRLELDISGIESQKTADFAALGRYYYAKLADNDASEEAQPMISAIRAKDALIAEKKLQISELERVIASQQSLKNSVPVSPNDSQQSSNCYSVPMAAFCMRCGSKLGNSMQFCPGCGVRISEEK